MREDWGRVSSRIIFPLRSLAKLYYSENVTVTLFSAVLPKKISMLPFWLKFSRVQTSPFLSTTLMAYRFPYAPKTLSWRLLFQLLALQRRLQCLRMPLFRRISRYFHCIFSFPLPCFVLTRFCYRCTLLSHPPFLLFRCPFKGFP